MFSTKINAIFVVLWAVLRYLFVKIFWPFFRPSKTSQKFKFYYNGDIISSDENAEAVVTRGHKIVFVGSHSKVKTSPKGFSASKCDVGNWIFSKLEIFEKLFGNCLDFFGIFGGFFWRIFLGGFFWRNFFGGIF